MTDPLWTPPKRPDWVSAMNREGSYFDLPAVVPLDENSLIAEAKRTTGLDDFGDDDNWLEGFSVLLKSLAEEAELTLMGRLMARSDILMWLQQRLTVIDTLKKHPEVLDEEIIAPMFIVGMPRSGTSILFELLCQDEDVGVPLIWEGAYPCPPPETATYAADPRIEKADKLFTQWGRGAPEFNTMHEMRGDIPSECGLLMAGTFTSDHVAAMHQTPSYSMWMYGQDFLPVYEWHKQVLQILQWKNPRKRWLLKAPEHQIHLDTLLKVYPDARIVQTHRDPIKCNASTVSLLGTLYYVRSEKDFDAQMFQNIIMGEATAQRLELVIKQRADGTIPESSIYDSRFQDLMDNPIDCIQGIYDYFNIPMRTSTEKKILDYLANKPKGKFGKHVYTITESKAKERHFFKRYQEHYNIPNEV